MRYLIAFALFFICMHAYGQAIITGKLLNEQRNPVANVNVSYKKPGSLAISDFTRSGQDGAFKLEIKIEGIDSVQLEFSHLSYVGRTVVVPNKTASYSYTLQHRVRELEEVKVANIPIYRRKDTINYNVGSFTSKQDRVISDIIRKLPGIEMRGEQILYQGKPIQKYMVNNLDLMEGRYAMINNNLPADAVKKVQVVENDQPVRILDSLIFSDRASLNLELKKFTSTGTGVVGAGLSPALWDLNLTPMTFGKTFQMLNSFQTNNVGRDAARGLQPFNTAGTYFGGNASGNPGPAYIFLRDVSSPDFDEKKWLDNKIFLLSTNVLQKLRSGMLLKGDVSYYNDTRQRKGFTATRYFTSEETIVNSESIDNRYRIHVFDAGALLEKNEKDSYLRNSFSYEKRWNRDRGDLLFNDADYIGQRREYSDESLLNAFSMARFIGAQLVNIRSTIEWHHTPQRLSVTPGQFQDILNDGMPYERMTQEVNYEGLRWDNSLGFIRRIKAWTFSPTATVNYNRSDLNTYITTEDNGERSTKSDGYINDMQHTQLNLSFSLRIGLEKQKWKLNLTMPYNLYYFNVEQQGIKTLNNKLRNTVNPSAGLTYLMNGNNEWSVNLSAGNDYGGLDNFYNGYIIGNYRSIQRYDARLLYSENVQAGIGYHYKNMLKARFASFSYNYSYGKRDYIFTTQLDPEGRTTTGIANQWSSNDNHSLAAGVSNLLFPVKTVIKLNGNVGWSRSDYLLNGVMSKQHVLQSNGTLEIINNSSSVISGEYRMVIGQSNNRLSGGLHNKVFYDNHHLNVSVYPRDRHMISLNNSFYHNNIAGQRNQYFLDVVYRYRVEKWRTDIEFTAQNLLNNSRYVQQYISSYEWIQSRFELRPRQFLISTKFKF